MDDSQFEKIKKWVVDQRIHAETESGSTTQSPCIFTVPPKLSDDKQSPFEPEIFYFGIINDYDLEIKKHFDRYWDSKMSHVQRLFKGMFGDINGSKTDQDDIESSSRSRSDDEVLKDMIHLVEKTRNCYDEPTRKSHDDLHRVFVTMVTDSYYVVQLLRMCNKFMIDDDEEKQLDACGDSNHSPFLAAHVQLPSLLRDLLKLSNQLPFFLLEKIFMMTRPGNDEPFFEDLFVTFFSSMLSLDESIYMLEPRPRRNYAHPLDICRSLFVFPIDQRREKKKNPTLPKKKRYQKNTHRKINSKLMYSAQELQEAGVEFTKKEGSHLLDISFHRRVLQIPPLSIDDSMIVALLNFVAFEQCDPSQRPYFTNYFLFIDSLINTTKDVEILRKNGIIRYPLGTEQAVVDLFNNFCKEMLYSFDQTYLTVDMNAVNRYCKAFYDSQWNIWWSNLKKEKFSSPWTCLSLFAAIVLLTLTMLQTFYTVFPYYHPN